MAMMKRRFSRVGLRVCLLLGFICAACGTHPGVLSAGTHFPTVHIEKIPADQFPSFSDDMRFDRLDAAIRGSIAYYRKLPEDRHYTIGKDQYSVRELKDGMIRFRKFIKSGPSVAEADAYVAAHGTVYCAFEKNRPVSVLFTGYFEPLLHGRRKRTAVYRFPVYSRPDDLVTADLPETHPSGGRQTLVGRYVSGSVVPYYDRETIESTPVLSGKAKVLAWVNDPVALFFLQIQGSGRIVFADKTAINVHYDISNGLAYRSIGKYLIDRGKISKEKMSMQAIRTYLTAHPEEQKTILDYNPRYVFFKIEKRGPVGCLNIELTPGRSIALDRRTAPPGVLAFIRTQKPVCDAAGKITHWTDFSRFALNQDTGSAIAGPARADIFWGAGAYAETASGYMKQPGRLYFIILTDRAP